MKKKYPDKEILKAIRSKSEEKINKVLEVLYMDAIFRNQAIVVINDMLFHPYKNDKSIQLELFGKGLMKFVKKIMEGSFKEDSAIRTYIIGICKNLAKDQNKKLQSKHNKYTVKVGETERQTIAELTNPESQYIEQESGIWAVVRRVIEQLDEKCKKYLILKHYKGKKNAEIAIEMKVAKNTVVNSYKPSCHQKLRQLLQNDKEGIEIIRERLKGKKGAE